MKRLLAYLFIVLGLGFTFNVNANAGIVIDLTNTVWKTTDSRTGHIREIEFHKNGRCAYKNVKVSYNPGVYYSIHENVCNWRQSGKKLYYDFRKYMFMEAVVLNTSFSGKLTYPKNKDNFEGVLVGYIENGQVVRKLKKQTQIAKAEPSQTQKVANTDIIGSDNFVCVDEFQYNKENNSYTLISKGSIKDPNCVFNISKSLNPKIYNELIDYMKSKSLSGSIAKTSHISKPLFNKIKGSKIAKAEPDLNELKVNFCKSSFVSVGNTIGRVVPTLESCDKFKGHGIGTYVDSNLDEFNKHNKEARKSYHGKKYNTTFCLRKDNSKRSNSLATKLLATKYSCEKLGNDYTKVIFENGKFLITEKTNIIVKSEPTITPKKKVEVAKVEEPKQEEFKPENKDIDNDAPIIEIAQNIIVSDTSYVIEGKVSDKSDKIFVEIDGQPIEVRKGKFKVKRYSPVDEQVKIVAIDQWGNKSKPKIVNIKINIEETVVAENLEPLNPSNIRTKSSNEKIAIIIGIENYSEAPKANYANLDAQYFFDYARKAFGVKKQNINLLINENATVVKTDKALSLWLKSKIKKNRSDLIIFFAGHGLASTDGKELYLLPQDGNPDRLERTALSRTDLFREIIELNPRNVTMFLDTCYSGVSRDEQMLLASARPIRIVADEQDGIPDNFTIFSASKLDQISSGLKEAKHGIFSYYLMKGLEGYADFNEDKKITNGELLAYMDENVSQKAAEQGREQNPSLAGDPDKVLISYR